MCMQCMAGVMATGAAATGLRGWIVARWSTLLTPRRRRALTVGLVAGALALSSVVVQGSAPADPPRAAAPAQTQ